MRDIKALQKRIKNAELYAISALASVVDSDSPVFTGEVTAAKYKLSALNDAPASATDTGTAGEIRITADYIYVCTATDTWVRAALATW